VTDSPLIEVRNLDVHFPLGRGLFSRNRSVLKAVNNISFQVAPGSALGIVGESGSGKSTLVRAMLRLLEPTGGQILFKGDDISHSPQKSLRPHRRHMQMVFQDTKSSLDPSMRVSEILEEPLRVHHMPRGREAVRTLLEKVGLGEAHIDRYPHQLSGGQRQRVGIARVLGLSPQLIVADEPVSALDVSIQAQILNLLRALRRDEGITFLLISHDISVVSYFCTDVGVMYLGNMVEYGPARQVIRQPQHPYTRSLISAVPGWKSRMGEGRIVLKGETPSPVSPPSGCPFHTRCPVKIGRICETDMPPKVPVEHGGWSACHLASPASNDAFPQRT
jgi:oligopeptide/dipeptide ABC transporter ATP-binding protein